MNAFIIDHETRNVNQTIMALGDLKTTKACLFYGQYHEDESYCRIYVETTWSESELDTWLWSTKAVGDYVGVCETENFNHAGTKVFERDRESLI